MHIVDYGKMIKKTKKGQMKIQQMAFMLIAVSLFFVVAGMFIILINFSGLKQSARALEEQDALLLVSKIASSPEFSCQEAFGNIMTDCIDLDKAMALKENIKDYSGFWGAGIKIMKVYPTDINVECTTTNYPDCGQITLSSSDQGTGVSNFVSLCRKVSDGNIYDKCELGRIIVTYASPQ